MSKIFHFFLRHPRITLCLLTILTHLTYLTGGFTWLDHGDIEQQRAIVPLSEIFTIFTTRYGETGYYRPLFTLLHSLNYAMFEYWAPGYHLTSIILHLLVVLLSYQFLYRVINFSSKLALLSAATIAVHADSWFTVGTITSAQELLMTIFLLIFFTSYHRLRDKTFVETQNFVSLRLRPAICLISATLALLSKETAFLYIPSYVLLYELFYFPSQTATHISSNKSPDRKKIITLFHTKYNTQNTHIWLSLFSLLILYIYIRSLAVPEFWKTSTPQLSFTHHVSTRLYNIWHSTFTLISPFPVSISDATPILSFQDFRITAAALFIICGIGLFIRSKRDTKFLIALTAMAISPILNILPLPRFWSPNYLYLTIIPATALIHRTLENDRKYKSPKYKRASYIAIGVWLSISSIATFVSGLRLENDLRLFTPAVYYEPHFKEGYYYLGNHYWQAGDLTTAQTHFELALEPDPNYISFIDRDSASINLAGVYFQQQNLGAAEELLLSIKDHVSSRNQELVYYNLALISALYEDWPQTIYWLNAYPHPWSRPEPAELLTHAQQMHADLQRPAEPTPN